MRGTSTGSGCSIPPDSSNFSANDPANWYVGATGDGESVPMNSARRWTVQAKLQIGIGTGKGIMLNGLYQTNDYRSYNHAFRLNPDGDYQQHLDSYLLSGSYTHVFSASSFLDATVSGIHQRLQAVCVSRIRWIPICET